VVISELQKELRKDEDFFRGYMDRFVDRFAENLKEHNVRLATIPVLNTLVGRLYLLMFSMNRDPRRELAEITLTLAGYRLEFKKVLMNTCLAMVKDYIDYVTRRSGPLQRVKALLDLVDLYISTTEDAYVAYIRRIEKKASEKEEMRKRDEEELAFGILKKMCEVGGGRVIVHTNFKGLFVDTNSEIVNMGEADVLIKTAHLRVYRVGKKVHLKCSSSPRPIVAVVEEIYPEKEEIRVTIKGFEELPEEHRRYVRVVPEEDIPVRMTAEGKEVVGVMADLCVRGVGVYTHIPHNFYVGSVVKVGFRLPKGEIETEGVIRHVSPHGRIYRTGIHFEPDLRSEEIISDYVMERQFEILREIKGLDL